MPLEFSAMARLCSILSVRSGVNSNCFVSSNLVPIVYCDCWCEILGTHVKNVAMRFLSISV